VAGYVRQSSADIIATAVVRANPLNVEYNALRDAFNASTGHKHDGTAAEGAYVPLIADSDALNKVVIDTSNNRIGVFVEVSSAAVEQIRIQDGAVVPVTTNDIDLGTSSLQFKDLFIDGTATVDALQVDANAVVTGNLTVNGNATLGNAASDTVTVTADVASPLLPSADDTYDLGAVGSEWRNLYIDGTANIDALVADTADINGGTVDGAVIGGASAAAGTFTSLTATGTSTLTTVDINGGNIDGTIIGASSAAAITGTTITGTSLVGPVTGDVTGNADTATALETARTIGGVSFNGTANINLPGVNTSGNQDTSGNAATATALETARSIGGVSFDGTSDINLAGVNTAGNQDTSGNAASATVLETARTIAGNSFNGSANITIAATDLSDTDQSLATSDNVQFASVTGNLTGNVTSTGSNSFGSITVSGTSTLNGNTVIGNANSDTVTVTADVASNLIPSADSTYSLGDSSNYWSHGYIDAVTTTGNVIVGGDLTVNGTTTTVNSNNMTVDDQLIELGNGRSGSASGDAGIVIERGDDANAFIGFDESANKFTVGTGTFTGASTGDLTITTGTLVANIEGNVTGNITGNVSGDVTGNADTATALETARTIGGVSFDGTSNINLPGVNASGNQDTSGNAATATALETARTIAGQSFNGTANITIAPTDLTGVNATATELNIMDGDTSATSTTLADADRVVVNDAGTMKQVALTDFETYMETSLDTLSNVTTVGALNSGSITSGFGAIDIGSSAITTTGTINFGSLADGSITATGFVDEDNMSSNSATLIPTQQSVKAYVDTVAGTSNNVTGLTATGAELNTVADFSAVSVDTSTAIASNDALLVFDNGNEIGYRDVDLLDTYFSGTTKTLTNKTLTSPVVTGMHLNDSGFTVEGSGADGNETTVAFTNPTADHTITFPNATGNVAVFTAAPAAAIADGSNGQVLTTNGSGVLSFSDMASGADLYAAETTGSTDPTASGTLSIAIGSGTTVSGDQAVAVGRASTVAGFRGAAFGGGNIASQEKSLALGFGANSTGLRAAALYGSVTSQDGMAFGTNSYVQANFASAFGYDADITSAGSYGLALGYQAQVEGSGATALTKSYASGTDSFAAAIANNTSSYGATGANSIAIGYLAKVTTNKGIAIGKNAICSAGDIATAVGPNATASGWYSTVIGGLSCSATQNYASALGGQGSQATGTSSTVAGGFSNTASGSYSMVTGGRGNTASYDYTRAGGYEAHSGTRWGKDVWASGEFSSAGDAQTGTMVLRADTTDATAEALRSNTSAAGTNNQVILPNNSAYSFSGTIIARESAAAGSDYASWEIKGALLRDANAASTVLGNGIQNKLYATSGASAWAIALSADTTNGGLKIEVTGAASTNIRWVATVNTSEVTYA